jgi:hypothetical protein
MLWVQVLGSLAALLSIVGVFHVLFAAESISNVGCGILLAMTCRRVHDDVVSETVVASAL